MTLKQSIATALSQSPVIQKARAEIRAAEGLAGQARANFLPQLSLSAGTGKYYAQPQTMIVDLGGSGPAPVTTGLDEQADTTSYSASLTQTIFTSGRLGSNLAMANAGLEISQQRLKGLEQELAFAVISTYYEVQKWDKMVELRQSALATAQKHLERVRSFLKAGMSTRADILRAEVQQANAELALTRAKQALAISSSHFNNILGKDLSAPVDLADESNGLSPAPDTDGADLLETAYQKRPDWQEFLLSKKIAQEQVGLARSGLWPSLALVGNYETGSIKYPSYSNEIRTWTALISGSWNIFDGTATWNRINEAQARLEAKEADETAVRKAIALEVKDAVFTLQSARENLAGAKKASELAEENLKLASSRYQAGLGTNLEMIDAQVALTQALVQQLEAGHAQKIAEARLNKSIGREVY